MKHDCTMSTMQKWTPGDVAWWITRDRLGTLLSKTKIVVATPPEPVRRSDGSTSWCVVTTSQRLVNVEKLFTIDDPAASITMPKTPKNKPAARKKVTAKKQVSTPAKTTPHQQPQASPAIPVDVLAIDFLNLLVRAWHTGKVTEVHAVRSMFQTVANAVRNLRPKRVVFALDGGHKHRSELLPTYKAHRKPSDPNLTEQKALGEAAIEMAGFCAVRVVDFEADDVLATIAEKHENVVICSSDKDLLAKGSTARIYHPWKGGKFPESFVKSDDVLGIPWHQVTDYLSLCGDTSDGIPGVKGIGDKKAKALLVEHGSIEGIMAAAIMGNVKGAVGKNLKANQSEAMKSRQIVELRDSLKLPELTVWRPPAGWQNRLQDMKLGTVASVVESIAELLTVKGEAEQPIAETVTPEATPEPASEHREPLTEMANDWTPWQPSKSPAGDYLPVAWQLGVAARTKKLDETECPYKAGTDTRVFWMAGFDGNPLISKADWFADKADETVSAKPEPNDRETVAATLF